MADNEHGGRDHEMLGLPEEDRRPWLEPVDETDEDSPASLGRLIGLALLLLALLAGGVWWMQGQQTHSVHDGELIAAAEGDYKIPPTSTGVMDFQGTGDASFQTSEGGEVRGKIDTSRAPEAPAGAGATGEADPMPAIPPAGGTPPAIQSPATGAATIQLGAYRSEALANRAWANMAKRFSFLSQVPHTIAVAQVGGGTVYRLHASAGSAARAADICSKMVAGGENCTLVR